MASYRAISYPIIPYGLVLYHITSYYIIQHPITSYGIVSYKNIYYILSYHTIYTIIPYIAWYDSICCHITSHNTINSSTSGQIDNILTSCTIIKHTLKSALIYQSPIHSIVQHDTNTASHWSVLISPTQWDPKWWYKRNIKSFLFNKSSIRDELGCYNLIAREYGNLGNLDDVPIFDHFINLISISSQMIWPVTDQSFPDGPGWVLLVRLACTDGSG